jgi:hypothetical protein
VPRYRSGFAWFVWQAPFRLAHFILCLWLLPLLAMAQTDVSGTIGSDTRWSLANSPYRLSADLVVQNNAILTIEAGVTLYMAANTKLTVQSGGVLAHGTAENPVRVLSDKVRQGQPGAPGDWGQWIFTPGTRNTRLDYVWFEHGHGLQVQGAAPVFNYLTLRNHLGAAISQDLAAATSGEGVQASGNEINGILVPAGEILGSATWALRGIPYVLASGVVSVGSAPVINLVTPASVQQGVPVLLGLQGNRLSGLSSVTFDQAGLQGQVQTGGSDSAASIALTVAASVPTGNARMRVQTDAGEALANLLVTRLQPKLTQLDPVSVTTNTQVTLTLTGTDFLPGSIAYFASAALPTTYVSPTTLTVRTSFANAAVTAISVRTPDPDNAGNVFVSNGINLTTRASTTKPDLTVSNVVVGALSVNPDGSYRIPVSYRITNIGGVAAGGNWYAGAYLSVDGVLGNEDLDLYGYYDRAGATLAPGANVDVNTVFVTQRAVTSGNYTLFIKADAQGTMTYFTENQSCSNGACQLGNTTGGAGTTTSAGRLAEESEANNASGIALTLPTKPDLTVSNVVVGTITVNPDGSYRIPVSYRINNIGELSATGAWYAGAYLSGDGVLGNEDLDLYGYYDRAGVPLAPGANVDVNTVFVTRRAVTSGNYTLFIKADAQGTMTYFTENQSCSNGACQLGNTTGGAGTTTSAGRLAEESEANNASGIALTLPTKPDLTVSNVVVGTISVNPDGSYRIPVSYRINNIGELSATGAWYAGAYLSGDGVLGNEDLDLYGYYDRAGATLAPGANVDVNTVFVTRRAVTSGNYTLFIKADAQGTMTYFTENQSCSNGACQLGNTTGGAGTTTSAGRLAEESEANNASGIALTLPTKPDLTVSNVVVGTISVNPDGSYRIPVSYRINNIGELSATGAWYAGAYLSGDGVLSNEDLDLYGYYDRAGATLAPGANVDVNTVFVTRRAVTSGNYTLFIKADAQGTMTYFTENQSCSNGACQLGNTTGGAGATTSAGRLAEESETNNATGIALTLPSKPDLTVSNVVVGTISVNPDGSYRIPVSYRINNIGELSATGAWYAGAYLSVDGVLSNDDLDLYGYYDRAGAPLAPGANVDVNTVFVTQRAVTSGNYTLFIKADAQGTMTYFTENQSCSNGACQLGNTTGGAGATTSAGRLAEESEANNATGIALTLPSKPDLTVSNVVVGAISVNPDGSYRIPVSYRINNIGELSATGAWYAGAYLSGDGVLGNEDLDLYGYYDRAGATLAPGANVDVNTVFVTRRAVTSGNYTLFIKADAQGTMTYFTENQSCSNGACQLGNTTGGAGATTSAGRLAEESETNNATGITLTLPTK